MRAEQRQRRSEIWPLLLIALGAITFIAGVALVDIRAAVMLTGGMVLAAGIASVDT